LYNAFQEVSLYIVFALPLSAIMYYSVLGWLIKWKKGRDLVATSVYNFRIRLKGLRKVTKDPANVTSVRAEI
jgi:hypothetical protein